MICECKVFDSIKRPTVLVRKVKGKPRSFKAYLWGRFIISTSLAQGSRIIHSEKMPL